MNQRDIATQITDLALELSGKSDLRSMLTTACSASLEPTGADGAGLFVLERGKVVTAAVAGDGLVEAELAHLDLGGGPCLQGITEREPIIIHDMSYEPRWTEWAAFMKARGWSSALAVRLTDSADKTIGSLNLFSRQDDHFNAEDTEVAEIFGGVISAALVGARTQDQLRQAIGARHSVGVAQGILMQRYDLPSVESGFEVLRRYSQDHNIKLARVATWVIEHRGLPAVEVH